jgi:hypothetical protein
MRGWGAYRTRRGTDLKSLGNDLESLGKDLKSLGTDQQGQFACGALTEVLRCRDMLRLH